MKSLSGDTSLLFIFAQVLVINQRKDTQKKNQEKNKKKSFQKFRFQTKDKLNEMEWNEMELMNLMKMMKFQNIMIQVRFKIDNGNDNDNDNVQAMINGR